MNVIFLDIDGVLQSYSSQKRFKAKENIITELSQLHGIDYSQYDFYDVAAAYYDWDKEAIERLKHILEETNSQIIVSSSWRSKNYVNKMKDLLALYGLDKYWLSDNPILRYQFSGSMEELRTLEIEESIEKYNVDNYVVIDDLEGLYEYFPKNCVITNNLLSESDMNKCIMILNKNLSRNISFKM